MKRIKTVIMAALTLAFLPTAAQARDWADVGGWSILEGDDFCMMHMEFEGPGDSTFVLARYGTGRNFIADVNSEWTAEKDKAYDDVAFSLNGETYSGGKAMGIDLLGKKGFAVKVGDDFLPDFAAAASIHIYKGETRIDRLNLTGSAAALTTVKQCVASIERRVAAEKAVEAAEARKQARFSDLPKDPFKD